MFFNKSLETSSKVHSRFTRISAFPFALVQARPRNQAASALAGDPKRLKWTPKRGTGGYLSDKYLVLTPPLIKTVGLSSYAIPGGTPACM